MISTRSSVSTHKKGSKVSCNTVCEMLLQIKKSYAISEFGPMRLMSPDQTRQGPVSSAPAWSDPSPQPGRGKQGTSPVPKGTSSADRRLVSRRAGSTSLPLRAWAAQNLLYMLPGTKRKKLSPHIILVGISFKAPAACSPVPDNLGEL